MACWVGREVGLGIVALAFAVATPGCVRENPVFGNSETEAGGSTQGDAMTSGPSNTSQGPSATGVSTSTTSAMTNPPSATSPSVTSPSVTSPSGTSISTTDMTDSDPTRGESVTSYIPESTGIVDPGECDPVAPCDGIFDDCGENTLKCVPIPTGAGVWASFGCVPLDPNPGAVGDSCIDTCATGPGVHDDCDVGLACLGEVCVSLCPGGCGVEQGCLVQGADVAGVCAYICDPLLQDCPENNACYSSLPSPETLCHPEGTADDATACDFATDCQPGLTCAAQAGVPNCAAANCCTPFCDLLDADCDDGRECMPYHADPLPANEGLGVCLLPG